MYRTDLHCTASPALRPACREMHLFESGRRKKYTADGEIPPPASNYLSAWELSGDSSSTVSFSISPSSKSQTSSSSFLKPLPSSMSISSLSIFLSDTSKPLISSSPFPSSLASDSPVGPFPHFDIRSFLAFIIIRTPPNLHHHQFYFQSFLTSSYKPVAPPLLPALPGPCESECGAAASIPRSPPPGAPGLRG